MAVQASQHMQTSVPSDAFAVDAPSRHHFTQQSPTSDNYRSTTSPPSSRRPSRHPSANAQSSNPGTPQQAQFRSPATSQPSSANTARALPIPPTTHSSPAASAPASSPFHQQSRREYSTDPDQVSGGPPIPPPPRTSSNHKSSNSNAPQILTDRTVTGPRPQKSNDGRESSSRYARPPDTSEPERQAALLTQHKGPNEVHSSRDDASAATAIATRSKRRGPTSQENGPQRSASTREARAQQPPKNVQSRSAADVQVAAPPNDMPREESEVINRIVVTDPIVDLEREKERLAEAVPVDSIAENIPVASRSVGNADELDNSARGAGRSRQDYSTNAAKRKETKFGEYMLGQTLGEGEFGKVKLGWKKDGSVQVAIKLIRRENLNTNPSRLPKIYREIHILRGLSHPNIVRLHEMVETDRHIGIILEYASGGELFDFILNNRYLKDHSARRLFAQLVSGVGYLHKKGIVHRDLKLENLLLDRNRNIIITDFGFANTFNPKDELGEEIEYNLADRNYVKRMDLERVVNNTRRGDLMQTSCGSPCYAAPELVVTDSLYTGRKVDVWSCGVILYAMLAGYLPFDDDPANPEGDNINLLYKYIVSTPLTFPEYVTPHARDLLRRILVPDPRQRADLFEVARHSWLSDYAHVVSHVTSSTTTVGEVASPAITAEDYSDAPLLTRSASVREPSKPHAPNASPMSGLNHQGKMDPEQAEKPKTNRDSKRRTVQVEYVAPQSQTVRGELSPTSSMAPKETPIPAQPSTQPPSRVRSGSQGPVEGSRQPSTSVTMGKPWPPEPIVAQNNRQPSGPQAPVTSNRAQQRPVSSQPGMQPPVRPARDVPRSVSDSAGAFGQLPATSATRPTTGGSMASTGGGYLASRGNSYSQPVAPTVAVTNAQGKLAQPKNGRQYNISSPIPQSEAYMSETSLRRPSTQQNPSKHGQALSTTDQPKAHRRSNTLTNIFGRSATVFGGRSQPQSPQEPSMRQSEKRYPPTSMKGPISSDHNGRRSSESRRPSFSLLRKNSDPSRDEKADKPRRFSLLPASFSFKSAKDQASGASRPGSRKQSISQQYAGNSPTQGAGFGQGASSPRESQDSVHGYDGHRERLQPASMAGPQSRRDEPAMRSALQPLQSQPPHFGSSSYSSPQQINPTRPLPPGNSFLINEAGPSNYSEVSIQRSQGQRAPYPPGFNSHEDEAPHSLAQQNRNGRGPGVLQKNNRKFADAYDQDHDPGHHAGSSGAAKRVMDFFRRRGKARAGDDR